MMTTFDSVPELLSTTTTNGISSGGGIARTNSTTGCDARCSHGLSPSSRPPPMPSTPASA